MTWIYILLGILVVLLIVCVLISRMMIEQLTNSPRCDVDKEREVAPTRGEFDPKDFEGLKIEEFHMTNKRGERLTGEIIYCNEPTDKVCIACHGWTSNRMGPTSTRRRYWITNFM